MNCAQMLAALAAQYDFVATPILQEGATHPDGGQLWSVKVREDSGDACGYRVLTFVVRDLGLPGETAQYLQTAPVEDTVKRTEFLAWIKETILAAPGDLRGVSIHWWNEMTTEAVFSMLVGTTSLTRTGYWIRMGQAAVPIDNFNIADYRQDCTVWPSR